MLYILAKTDQQTYNKVLTPFLTQIGVSAKWITSADRLEGMQEGDVVLCCGTKVIKDIEAKGGIKKKSTIAYLRKHGVVSPDYTLAKLLFTNDPGSVFIDHARRPEIQWDLALAKRLHETGSTEPAIGKYRYVDDFTDVIQTIKDKFEKSGKKRVAVSTDLETMGLIPQLPDKRIVSISITVEEGRADVVYFNGVTKQPASPVYAKDGRVAKYHYPNKKLWDQLKWLFTSDKIKMRGANLKFDEGWTVEEWGLEISNFKFDTTLVGSLLDENRSNSLNMHAKIYCPEMGGYDDEFNLTVDKAHMEKVPQEKMLPYAGGDTDACLRVSRVMTNSLMKDRALTRFYAELLHPSARVFRKMESRGMVVDLNAYKELESDVRNRMAELESSMMNMIPRQIRLKYSDDLKISRPAMLVDFLFNHGRGLKLKPRLLTEKTQKPSTAMEHFEMFDDVPDAVEFVRHLKEYNSASKTLSTYITGFLKHLRPDGRFHPSYMLHKGDYHGDESGTVTGRTSAKDPAYQTIPKHTIWAKPLRRVYPAPPGYVVLNVDFSQGELRVAACVAEEPTMIEAYKNGIDLHSITAAKLVGLEFDEFMKLPKEERAEARSGGKAGNFGLLYAMQAPGFRDYARKTYGVILTDQQSVDFRDGFFELYPRLLGWHEEYQAFAHKNLYIRSPLGRIRHLPLINSNDWSVRSKQERQAINSPIQSTLSDLAQLAMVHIDRQYPDLQLVGMTHDSVTMYVPEDEVEMWAQRVVDIMENLPLDLFGWNPPLKFVADAEFGPNMADTEELKLAA